MLFTAQLEGAVKTRLRAAATRVMLGSGCGPEPSVGGAGLRLQLGQVDVVTAGAEPRLSPVFCNGDYPAVSTDGGRLAPSRDQPIDRRAQQRLAMDLPGSNQPT